MSADLEVVRAASLSITELGSELDAQLARESRPPERLRLLRAATNRMTRTANDAIAAYRRAINALTSEQARANGDQTAASDLRDQLRAARLDLLRVIERAGERYPAVPAESIETTDGQAPKGST